MKSSSGGWNPLRVFAGSNTGRSRRLQFRWCLFDLRASNSQVDEQIVQMRLADLSNLRAEFVTFSGASCQAISNPEEH
jgi:hypothetical protein